MQDDLPPVRYKVEAQTEALSRLDFERLWHLCGGEGAASDTFEHDVKSVMRRYRLGPDRFARMPAKERTPHYRTLERVVGSLRDQLETMHPHIAWELETAGINHEPEGFLDQSIGEPHEGLSYSEYLMDALLNELAIFSDILRDAQADNRTPRGKPKQNSNLETTIRGLGAVYQKHTEREPMAGYRYNDIDESQPYQGRFLNFIQATIWAFNGAQKPSSHAIGEAARRAFGLRK